MTRGKRGRRAAIALTAVVAPVLLLAGLVWAGQRSVIYLPSDAVPPPASGTEDVRLATDDGLVLDAWFLPPRGGDRGAAVLLAHGNAGNRESRLPLARALAAEGFSVLLFDYRGYGGNEGSPSEQGLAADARAAADHLAERGFAADRTLYFGESLGAAVAAGLAAERPPAGLFLRSPFSSLADMGERYHPFLSVRPLLRDHYPVTGHVAQAGVPTTVVLGDADGVVPPEQSRAVARACPRLVEQVVLPGADHNDAELAHGPEVIAAFTRLADQALPAAPPRPPR